MLSHFQAESQPQGKPSLQQTFRPKSHGGHGQIGFSRVRKQLLSTLPATATTVSAANQRAGLYTQEDKAEQHRGQGGAGR